MKRTIVAILFCLVALCSCTDRDWKLAKEIEDRVVEPTFRNVDYVVSEYGAVGDGVTDALPAINEAIVQCSVDGGGRVVIPTGKWFCKGSVVIKSNVNLHFEEGAELVFSTDENDFLPCVLTRWEGTDLYNYSPMIYAYNVHNIAITGRGILNGQGKAKFETWKAIQKPDQRALRKMGTDGVPVQERIFGEGHYLRPAMMDIIACSRILIEDVMIVDGTFWSFHLVGCNNATVRRICVDCTNFNSDGVDPESSTDVIIEDCYFHTGDDGIAVKSGRDQDGWRQGQPTENVIIRRCTFNTEANGICIGSEISGGVRNIFVEDCHIINSKQGLYFKSNLDRGGYIENVFIRNIDVEHVDACLIKFEPNYKSESTHHYPTLMRNFKIKNIKAGKADECGIYLVGFEDMPVQDVTISNLTLEQTPEPYVMKYYKGLTLKNIEIIGKDVSAQEAG